MLLFALMTAESFPASSVYDQEILIMVKEGTVQMPLGQASAAVEDVTFTPPEIKQTLLDHTAKTISMVFPDFDPADTLFETRIGTTIVRKLDLHLEYKIYLTDARLRDALNDSLLTYQNILSSQNNGTLQFSTNDPYFDRQWGLHNTGQTGGPEDIDIDAPEAWQLEEGDQTIVIGILDSGVKTDHEDFLGKASGDTPEGGGWGYHGTAVAGIAAAWGDNNTGIAGVNWNGHFISKRRGDYPDTWDAIVEFLGYNTLEAINCSWVLWGDIILVHRIFALAHNVGVALVASRGNTGHSDPTYPACFGDWMISVGALTDENFRADYSYYGNGMDFLAPGGAGTGNPYDIYTTWYDGVDSYDWFTGTSAAAPHVSGIISLIHDYTDLRVADEFEAILKRSCIDMGDLGYDDETGWGRVNADSALKLVTFPQEIFRYQFSYAAPYEYFGESDPYVLRCYDWPGLDGHGDYRVRRQEVRGDVLFQDDINTTFGNTPILVPMGYFGGIERTDVGEANYHVRFCEIVPGTLTGEGATFRTYIYRVRSLDGQIDYGYLPRAAEDVRFHYTVIGNAAPAPPTGLSVTSSPDYHPYLQWDHNTEADLLGYQIYRMVHYIEEDWVLIGDVPAGTNYFKDTEYSTPHPGPYAYWTADADYTVTAYDDAETESEMPPFVTIIVVTPERPSTTPSKQAPPNKEIPDDFGLYTAYPNPFNALTTIKYALPEPSFVEIEIFNVSGQRIEILHIGNSAAGYHEVIWDASNVSSGIYFYRIHAGTFSETRRMTLLK